MITVATWHGTPAESLDLVNAVANNCACPFDAVGARVSACEPHQMLATDQRALDGLLFVRRMAAHLQRQEFSVTAASASRAAA